MKKFVAIGLLAALATISLNGCTTPPVEEVETEVTPDVQVELAPDPVAEETQLITNEEKGYSIVVPAEYVVEDNSMFNKDEVVKIIINTSDVSETYELGEIQLDAELSGTIQLDGITANKYTSLTGYCDGPGCSDPFTLIAAIKNEKMYRISFYNDIELNSENTKILSTFKFLEAVIDVEEVVPEGLTEVTE